MEKNADNKVLDKAILSEYGFEINELKTKHPLTVMSKDKFEVVIGEDNTISYSNVGIQYPLKDVATLKKVYKEVKREDLKPA